MMHFNMFEANSGRLQRELAEVEQRVNIIRRLLQQQVSTRFQDTQGIEEAIQVAEKIEALVRLSQQGDPSVDRQRIWRKIARLRSDLQNRIDRLDEPEIDSTV